MTNRPLGMSLWEDEAIAQYAAEMDEYADYLEARIAKLERVVEAIKKEDGVHDDCDSEVCKAIKELEE